MEDPYLFQPLLPSCSSPSSTTTTTTITLNVDHDANNIEFSSSNSSIFFRLLSIIFIALIAIWANYEASKGFKITIINEAKDSPAGQRFTLFYISNDKATRIVLNTSTFVETMLYSNTNHTKKQVNHVTLRFTSQNVSNIVTVVDTIKNNEYVIYISPYIMEDTNNVDYAIISAVQRAMARIWLWDGESRAPRRLIDGIIEYISMLAGFGHEKNIGGGGGKLPIFGHTCWEDKDPMVVAQFLNYCEEHEKGFIQRLNQVLRDQWDDRTVDDALGDSAQNLCGSYKKSFEFSL